jgi:hypothetical protein
VRHRAKFSEAFTKAVSQSALGMLNICAFVVFFSAFLGVLEQLFSRINLPDTLTSLIFCAFELTTGLSKICSQHSPLVLSLCALGVGWSGLSVHFQTLSVCSPRPLNIPLYFAFHAVRVIICLALSFLVF